MSSILTIAMVLVGIAAILLIIGWLGFQIEPDSFSPHPEKTKDEGTVDVPPDIPVPLKRYYEAAAGNHVPVIKSAIVWGKAKLRINGIWMPVRFKEYYLPGQAFIRYLEVTWFGKTFLKVSDSYKNGEGGQNEEKTPWLINITEWMTSHYIKIPSRFSVTWEDEGSPWSYWTVEDVEYNVDVGKMINETQELGRVMR